jgi:conjugal transfer pilus assembly protein TraL
MGEEDFWIPRKLDASPLFFIWEADIAMVYVVWILLGGVLNMILLGIFFALVFGRGYARLKEEGGKGLIIKLLYWYTPSEMWIAKSLPSHLREFVGG